jgi:hypothetical protein
MGVRNGTYALGIFIAMGCSSPPPPPPVPNPATCLPSDQITMHCTQNADCCSDSCIDDGMGDGKKICDCSGQKGTCSQSNDCCVLTNTCVGYSTTVLGTCQ